MQIFDITNDQYAEFTEKVLSNIKNEKISDGPVKINKVKNNQNSVQVFAKQRNKYLVDGTTKTQKYIVTFENDTGGKISAVLEMDLGRILAIGKRESMSIDISKEANQYFEAVLKQTDESSVL